MGLRTQVRHGQRGGGDGPPHDVGCPIDVRVSSSINNANFATDGIDAAIRNLPRDAAHDEALEVERLFDQSVVPVCSPALVEKYGPFTSPDMLKGYR
jgi:LysR family transcriptional regulator, glycine cleavage system transcriptional activator